MDAIIQIGCKYDNRGANEELCTGGQLGSVEYHPLMLDDG